MVDRDHQLLARPGASPVSTDAVEVDPEPHGLAQEAQPAVLLQRAGQQPGFGQHLEAVADADHRPAGRAKRVTAAMIGEKRARAPGRR